MLFLKKVKKRSGSVPVPLIIEKRVLVSVPVPKFLEVPRFQEPVFRGSAATGFNGYIFLKS